MIVDLEYISNDMFDDEEYLEHYGMPRRSGRYPYGSGEHPYQHEGAFLKEVRQMQAEGKSEKEIASYIGLSTGQLRTQMALAKAEERSFKVATAKALQEKGYSLKAIADKMGFQNDSSVRTLLNEDIEARKNASMDAAESLKTLIDEKGMLDVTAGVERELGISKEKLNEALYILELEGYPNYKGRIPQVTNPGKQTTQRVVCPPGTEHKDIYNYDQVHSVTDYHSDNDGKTIHKAFSYPESMDSKRMQVRYAEDGGELKDGVIELRRGVEDLSLGESNYAQVRILVDGTHYLKGMAVYSDNMPDGVDVIFNTNKHKGTPVLGPKDNTVLKNISDDPDNPFGSLIKEKGGQYYYTDKNGKEKLGLINKRAEEGDWGDWKDKLPSQFLSKQNVSLVKQQLNLELLDKRAELEEISNLNNPTVKRARLQEFADTCDSASVHLKAAALPRQKYKVILPLTSVGDNEVYAPTFKNGETVALIRYPHGGTFEIPILKVNNKNKEGQNVIRPDAKDAIGINKKVADQLSGADFDGDTVMVVPCNSPFSKTRISYKPPLKALEGFDPKVEYAYRPGIALMSKEYTQKQMGIISNLITDMTIKGASDDEIARAVKHSMVVIDANKHRLDYKRSEIENNISGLKKKYQENVNPVTGETKYGGASTLLSRAKSQTTVLKRHGSPIINPDGTVSYKTSEKDTYINEKGETVQRTQRSTKMAEAKDARALSSGTQVEEVYAQYANTLKTMANTARKEMVNTKGLEYKREAAVKYKAEVDSLNKKLDASERNAPKERAAQRMVNASIDAKLKSDPDLKNDKALVKKMRQQEIVKARESVGAHRTVIDVSDAEWKAIQSGAISDSKLSKMLKYIDPDRLKELSTPRDKVGLKPAQIARIDAMKDRGFTTAEIADALGVSTSTIVNYSK